MTLILLFVIGLFVGSFISVVVARRRRWSSIWTGRSHCPHCHHQLQAIELIPLISFVFQRGRCSHCHRPISWQYPAIELMTGAVFALLSSRWPTADRWSVVQFVLLLFTMVPLLIMVVTDLIEEHYPTAVVYLALAMSSLLVVIRVLATPAADRSFILGQLLLGGFIGGGMLLALYAITRRKGIGVGDIYLGATIGLLLGAPVVWLALAVSFIGGGVVAGGLLLMGKKQRGDSIPLGPFLVAGLLVMLLFGADFVQWWVG